MSDYLAPTQDMHFVIDEIAELESIAALPGYEDATSELVEAVLEQAGKLAGEVFSPLNHPGDEHGTRIENGVVVSPPGYSEAYRQFVDNGWQGIGKSTEINGQGLPFLVHSAVAEMWDASNLAFALCPLLTSGAIEAIESHATPELRELYLPQMISGEWSGTMNLTEPQAGTDLAAIKTRAQREADHYRIHGQKIFITWGEHELTDNIVHLVLARLPDAPAGIKGISLFLVPKYLVNADGSKGERNDLRVVSLETKMGIHSSPTCVMAYGDTEGAIGYLIGEENNGLACMFTMMNNARLMVGIQGVGIAERALQEATAYAAERRQGRAPGWRGEGMSPIIEHPDIRRTLLLMRGLTQASRAICYACAHAIDKARGEDDAGFWRERANLLTPLAKAFSSDAGFDVASLGIQVHGGMGYIEETGAAQYYRDVRVAPIYEGTNGVQALDLLTRKLLRDRGAAVKEFLAEMTASLPKLGGDGLGAALEPELARMREATDWLLETGATDLARAAAGATPYLRLFGTVTGAWLLARGAAAARRRLSNGGAEDRAFLEAKIATAQFYMANILPRATAEAAAVIHGADSTLALDEAQF